MKNIFKNKNGVSNVLAYLFSITLITMVTSSSIFYTNILIEDKTQDIAGQNAQLVANKISYILTEALTMIRSDIGLNYNKTISIPHKIAGVDYYIEIVDNYVYVNGTNGIISKKASFQYLDEVKINLENDRVYGASGRINFAFNRPDYLYKLDFGTGNITSHSPVGSDYYMVLDGVSGPDWPDENDLDEYNYRLPIKVANSNTYDLKNVSVKLSLSVDNIDYSKVECTYLSSSKIKTNFVFYDPKEEDLDNRFRPYYVDYWNPDGESLIYLNLSIKKDTTKYIYLYYGSNTFEKYSISDISLFFEDFNNLDNWTKEGFPTVSNGKIIIGKSESIVSKGNLIPSISDPDHIDNGVNQSEAMYIVEIKEKFEKSCQNKISLLKNGNDFYQIYLNHTSPSKISISKNGSTNRNIKTIKSSRLSKWLRVKNYIYVVKYTYDPGVYTNVTLLNTNVFNYSNFTFFGNCSIMDTYPDAGDDAVGEPYKYGKIELSGPTGGFNGDVTIDWLRIMKIPSLIDVSIGPMEIKDEYRETNLYTWSANHATHREDIEFANPLLCDFHYGNDQKTLTFKNLEKGTYTFSVTKGDYSSVCMQTTIKINSDTVAIVPYTEAGEFKTVWFSYEHSSGGDLGLKFSGSPWQVNSITVQKGNKGISVEGASIYG